MKRVIRVLEYFGEDKWIDDILDCSYLRIGNRVSFKRGSLEEIARHERGEKDEKEEKEKESGPGMGDEEKLDEG